MVVFVGKNGHLCTDRDFSKFELKSRIFKKFQKTYFCEIIWECSRQFLAAMYTKTSLKKIDVARGGEVLAVLSVGKRAPTLR